MVPKQMGDGAYADGGRCLCSIQSADVTGRQCLQKAGSIMSSLRTRHDATVVQNER